MSDTTTHVLLTALMTPLAPESRGKAPKRWQQITLTELSAAEELLDELEQTGCAEKRFAVSDDSFVIRWR